MKTTQTVIIGGGIAGLACARLLLAAGRDFVLLTDRLGGRIYTAPGGAPFGATYITSDYRHVSRYVRRGRRIHRRNIFFLDRQRFITVWNRGTWKYRRALVRLYSHLIAFRHRLNHLRDRCPFVCQARLLQEDPLLLGTVRQPASDFLAANGLEEVDEVFTGPLVNTTLFTPGQSVNTFYYLAAIMPILLPTWTADFSHTLLRLTAGLGRRLVPLPAIDLDPNPSPSGWFRVRTAEDSFDCRNVVVATPDPNTRRFCPALTGPDRLKEIAFSTVHVVGARRPEYLPGKTIVFRPNAPVTILFPVPQYGCDMLYCKPGEGDLSPYYPAGQVVGRVDWKLAVQLSGASWRPLNPRPGLFTIGDHNICGLEDAFLTGLFAGNRIAAS